MCLCVTQLAYYVFMCDQLAYYVFMCDQLADYVYSAPKLGLVTWRGHILP